MYWVGERGAVELRVEVHVQGGPGEGEGGGGGGLRLVRVLDN